MLSSKAFIAAYDASLHLPQRRRLAMQRQLVHLAHPEIARLDRTLGFVPGVREAERAPRLRKGDKKAVRALVRRGWTVGRISGATGWPMASVEGALR